MERTALQPLKNWLTSVGRKPLVIRGARQVGKTWLVRQFAKTAGKTLVELNFEKQPSYASFFSSNDPQQILLNLTAVTNEKINPENTVLFLDEIQAVPQLLSKLRWFCEDLAQLPVIAAGSLLEFVLAEHSFSMPVGRISYMHLEPLSFEEFLLASDKKALFDYLKTFDLTVNIPLAIHEQLMLLFKTYVLVGGLPSAVASWIVEHSPSRVSQIQHDLLATYRDDFAKYKSRIATERLEEVLVGTPKMLGKKFVFSRVNASVSSNTIKQALTLLEKARICCRVQSCSANGVPLASEIKEKYFKEIFLDTGLCCAMLGLNLSHINAVAEMTLVNQGGIAEQVVGQLLRTIEPSYIEPTLYCWNREEPGASAEIDYVIAHGNQAIPIEVKAGATGSLKSLHLFMGLKKIPVAIRINSDVPSKTAVKSKDNFGNQVEYTLISLPFYLAGEIHRLLDESHRLF